MGRMTIACYRAKNGMEEQLRELMKTHLPVLKSQDLVTDRSSIIMQAADGAFIEVFEWKSAEAIEAAHTNPEVLKMWQDFAEACDYIPIAAINEASDLFSEFTPVDLEKL